MRAPIFARPLTEEERQTLKAGLRSSDAFVLRRCQIIVASTRGKRANEIAQDVGCSDEAVRQVIHGFNAQGLAILQARSRRPHRTRAVFDAQGLQQLQALLHHSPREFGKSSSVWTLELAAEVSFAQGLTPRPVSGETIRANVQRLDIQWQRAKRWITSPDPAYTRKKTHEIG